MFSGRNHKDVIFLEKNSLLQRAKATVPPLPLDFDRVNEGQAPKSSAPLLNTPVEILTSIIQFVPFSSLASLALVNRDCRQLARSRQFGTVTLDYSDASLDLIALLLAEGRRRVVKEEFASLGVCVRRIEVAIDYEWMIKRHNLPSGTVHAGEDKLKRDRLIDKANYHYFNVYVRDIQALLSNHAILPYLELLRWADETVFDQTFYRFLNRLTHSLLQHLRLYLQMDELFDVELTSSPVTRSWPLKTLYVDTIQSDHFRNNKLESNWRVCTSLMRHCAPTLQSFSYAGITIPMDWSAITEVSPRFPSLRYLRIAHEFSQSPSALDTFIQHGIRILEIDTGDAIFHREFFAKRGRIDSLETLICLSRSGPSIDFLRANNHLSKLSFPCGLPPIFLEAQLLPLLSESFTALKSLSITFDARSILPSALEIISSLGTLEQIHLGAGEQVYWHDWQIKHNVIRDHLCGMPRLRRLAFSRDTYDEYSHSMSRKFYYRSQEIRWDSEEVKGVYDVEADASVIWELIHQARMAKEAAKYMWAMKGLEWIFLGQIEMKIEPRAGDVEGELVMVSGKRDEGGVVLDRMFESVEERFGGQRCRDRVRLLQKMRDSKIG